MDKNGALPLVPLPEGTVEIGGQTVHFHALSRGHAVGLQQFQEDPGEAEPYMIAKALDISEAEARDWLDSVPFDEGTRLLEAIVLVSGLPSKA